MAAVKAGDVVWNITGETKGLDQALRTSGVAITAFGAGITAVMGLAAKSAVSFRGELSKVNTLGVKNLEALGDGIKDVTASIGVDLAEATQQTYQIISAGIPEENALDFLRQSAIAAKAGIGELGDAVDLGTSTLNAFGLSAQDAGKIFDITQVAIDQGKTTIGEMGQAVGRVAPLFAAAGLSADEMFASISALTTGGIQTKEAVSGLKAALANILVPGKEAAEAAEDLGVQFNATGLRTLGFVGLMDQLKTATGGNIDEMTRFFPSIEALNVALALTGEQSGTLTETLNMMKDSTGFSAEAFARLVENNPAEALAVLKGQVSVLAVEVGEALLPILKGFVDILGPIVTGVTDFINTFPRLSSGLILATAGVGGLALVMGPLLIVLPSLVSGFGLLTGASFALSGAKGMGGVLTIATKLGPIIGPLGIGAAIAGTTLLVLKAAQAWHRLAIAEEAERQQSLQVDESIKRLISTLSEQGVEIDEAAVAGLNYDDAMSKIKESVTAAEEAQQKEISALNGVNQAFFEATTETDALADATSEATGVTEQMALAIIGQNEAARQGTQTFSLMTGELSNIEQPALNASFAVDRLAESIRNLPPIPGLGVGPGPNLPGMASGGISPGGLTMLHEQGPEAVFLPRGAGVVPAPQTAQMMASRSGPVEININMGGVTVGSDIDVQQLADRMAVTTRRELIALGFATS